MADVCAGELDQQVKSLENWIIQKWLLFCWLSLLNQLREEVTQCWHERTVGSALQAAACCKTRHLHRYGHSSVFAISMPCFSISVQTTPQSSSDSVGRICLLGRAKIPQSSQAAYHKHQYQCKERTQHGEQQAKRKTKSDPSKLQGKCNTKCDGRGRIVSRARLCHGLLQGVNLSPSSSTIPTY